MKRFLSMVALLLGIFGSVMAEDKVTAKVFGTSLKIGLENEISYVAFQMDITLPKEVDATHFAAVSTRLGQSGEDNVVGSTKFIVANNEISTTETAHTYRVIAYNLANASIAGNSGDDILDIALSATVADPTSISVSAIKFVKASDLSESNFSDVQGQAGYKKGDVNGDLAVDLFDITDLIDMYLGKVARTGNWDVYSEGDGKGVLDVFDITTLIDIYLGK